MVIERVVTQLKQEVARINEAIAALEALTGTESRRSGTSNIGRSMQASRPRRRTMSAAARAKIAAAQRARWAKQRTGATRTKTTPVKTSRRGRMSPAARKRLSALMKAGWAARKRARRQRAA